LWFSTVSNPSKMVEVDRLVDSMKLEYSTFRVNLSVVIKPIISST
jgi:hypothetical protein